ncbi:MAG TPA: hypothetical protein PLI09_00035 [Candidatus Hydrogenedentes bacterium]|nr:hypothetical protein [Candidatus Hydrogenedentota bacterium]
MNTISEISNTEAEQIWKEVREEFPEDEAMQQVHFVRLMHYHQLKGCSAQETIAFYQVPEHDHQQPAKS